MSLVILDSSPAGPIGSGIASRRPLKRSASTASLPTPPQTIENKKRYSRSRSRGSDHETDSGTDADSDTHTRPTLGQGGGRLHFGRKKQRTDRLDAVVDALSGEDAENPFWDAPPATDAEDRSPSPPPVQLRVRAPVSPPPSRRQTAVRRRQAPTTPKAGSTSQNDTSQDPIRDSPNNPFLSDSPASVSGEPMEPRTPTEHSEKPTISYVFRGVKTAFANPLYNLSPSAREHSLLPVEHPDFSPDPACPPKLLFTEARRRRRATSPSHGKSRTSSSRKAEKQISDGEWDDNDANIDLSPPKRLFQAPC